MKIILYMAITANGIIAKKDDDTSWISKEEADSFSLMARKAGNLVMGRRTYNIITRQPEFSELLKAVKLVVVTKENPPHLIGSNHSVASSPKEALKLLKDFEEVIITGGSILNRSFLIESLVDEIYLDIEPIVLGKGIALFSEGDYETKLELVGTKKLSKDEIQLHYKVNKAVY